MLRTRSLRRASCLLRGLRGQHLARPTAPLVLHIDYWSGNNSRTSWGAYYCRATGRWEEDGRGEDGGRRDGERASERNAPLRRRIRRAVMLIKGNLSATKLWPWASRGLITNTCGLSVSRDISIYRATGVEEACVPVLAKVELARTTIKMR